ncbi:hypothetical protein GCM10023191_077060 [Actinoallomurus oryzae]|uniref:Uncharacterized protein n=1 Tax=Actinoallomurus oryzae TaxID=502180 RepID=A0ABP8QWP1_9ACTN
MKLVPTVGVDQCASTTGSSTTHNATATTNSPYAGHDHPAPAERLPSTAVPATSVNDAGSRASRRHRAGSAHQRVTRTGNSTTHTAAATANKDQDSHDGPVTEKHTDTMPPAITTAPAPGDTAPANRWITIM